jgi:hypothetical protein
VNAFAGKHQRRVQHAEPGQPRDQGGEQLDEGGVDVPVEADAPALSRHDDFHVVAAARDLWVMRTERHRST